MSYCSKILLLSSLALVVTGCSALPDWLGNEGKKRLPGERISVLPSKSNLTIDQSLEEIEVTLPPVAVNTIWLSPHFGQTYHLALTTPIDEVDSEDIGSAADEDSQRLMSPPVIAKDTIFVLDGEGIIRAVNKDDLSNVIWEADLKVETFDEGIFGINDGLEKEKFLGGQISYEAGTLFATTVVGDVIAFDARNGKEIWRRSFKLPIKSPPIAEDNAVYVITLNNNFYALDATSGKTLWNHAGITETTGILGGPSPAISDGVVVVPYSSGEIYAMRKDTGALMWGDSLAALSIKNTSLFSLNDIDASPIIYDGIVYSVGHEGILSAVELNTSRRIWEQEISSISPPWIAGNFLYILSTKDELICIHRPDGRIKWITALPSYEDVEDNEGKITWNGPVVAGNRVFAVNSVGELWSLSPKTGGVENKIDIDDEVFLAPIVSGRKMYLLSNNADLIILE